MENILYLPIDLLKGRLFDFLNIVDIARLDEANQNHATRLHIIEAVTSTSFSKCQDIPGDRDKLSWLNKRKVHCTYLELGHDVGVREIYEFRDTIAKVEHLLLRCCKDFRGGLADLLQYSKALSVLELHSCVNLACEDAVFLDNGLTELRLINCAALEDDTFCAIVEHSPLLEVVDISGSVRLSEASVESLCAFCPKLREFHCKDMAEEAFTSSCLSLIADCCPEFEKLVCDGLLPLDEELIELAENCPDLRSLELGECQLLSSETVVAFSKLCQNLQTFVVDYCDISDAAVGALLHNCGDTLTTFSIDSASDVTSASLSTIATHCTALTSLHLGNFPELPTVTLIEIVASCTALHTLEVPGCDMMNDAVLQKISACSTSLTAIDISEVSGFSDEALMELFKACTSLESVSMNHMVVKDCVLMQLGLSCRKLHTLSLTSSVLTTNGLSALSTHCSTLTTLRISDTFVDDVGIMHILQRNSFLTELNVNGCNIADGSMQIMSAQCTKLRKLYMDRCPHVTADGFMLLATRCTQLREVWVCEGKFVVDKTITALAQHCRYLEILRVNRCKKLTKSILRVISSHCHYLRRVEFNECAKVFGISERKFVEFHEVYEEQLTIVSANGEELLFV